MGCKASWYCDTGLWVVRPPGAVTPVLLLRRSLFAPNGRMLVLQRPESQYNVGTTTSLARGHLNLVAPSLPHSGPPNRTGLWNGPTITLINRSEKDCLRALAPGSAY